MFAYFALVFLRAGNHSISTMAVFSQTIHSVEPEHIGYKRFSRLRPPLHCFQSSRGLKLCLFRHLAFFTGTRFWSLLAQMMIMFRASMTVTCARLSSSFRPRTHAAHSHSSVPRFPRGAGGLPFEGAPQIFMRFEVSGFLFSVFRNTFDPPMRMCSHPRFPGPRSITSPTHLLLLIFRHGCS